MGTTSKTATPSSAARRQFASLWSETAPRTDFNSRVSGASRIPPSARLLPWASCRSSSRGSPPHTRPVSRTFASPKPPGKKKVAIIAGFPSRCRSESFLHERSTFNRRCSVDAGALLHKRGAMGRRQRRMSVKTVTPKGREGARGPTTCKKHWKRNSNGHAEARVKKKNPGEGIR